MHWYQGTADAVYQNIYTLEKERPTYVLILAGDHIYKMNYRTLLEFHQQKEADLTIAALRVGVEEGREFGVMQVDADGRLVGFEEKKPNPKPIPGDPGIVWPRWECTCSTPDFCSSNCASTPRGQEAPTISATISFPSLIDTHRLYAFPFRDENRKQDAYWRNVGTLDAYFAASMDLISVDPLLNMYDSAVGRSARIIQIIRRRNLCSPKRGNARRGEALDSIVCQGSIVSGGQVKRSILGFNVRVNSFAQVEDSICSTEWISAGMRTFAGRSSING